MNEIINLLALLIVCFTAGINIATIVMFVKNKLSPLPPEPIFMTSDEFNEIAPKLVPNSNYKLGTQSFYTNGTSAVQFDSEKFILQSWENNGHRIHRFQVLSEEDCKPVGYKYFLGTDLLPAQNDKQLNSCLKMKAFL